MELNTHNPVLIPAKTAVLLVFLPTANDHESSDQRLAVTNLVTLLQQQLGRSIRVLKLDATLHPDVVRSFDVRQFPAFVLVQQGIELWRQEGIVSVGDEAVDLPNLIARVASR